jgi:hypothetical protein
MIEMGFGKFPRDSEGAFPPELELAMLGVLSRLAKVRELLIGKPFEVADAQALLTLLEVALPGVLTKLAQRAEDRSKDADADNGLGGEAS